MEAPLLDTSAKSPGPGPAPGIADHLIGKHVIIRASAAGVHAGILAAHDGGQGVRLTDSRRLWRWWAASGVSLSGVARTGLKHEKSKIEWPLDDLVIFDACEIIPTSLEGQASIEGAPIYEP